MKIRSGFVSNSSSSSFCLYKNADVLKHIKEIRTIVEDHNGTSGEFIDEIDNYFLGQNDQHYVYQGKSLCEYLESLGIPPKLIGVSS
jgi:hypothetical protein